MASAAIYTHPSDNVAPNATAITIHTGTDPGDPNYDPDVLVDQNPARVAKILSTTFAWKFEFASRQRVDLFALIHGTFEVGCTLRLKANDTDSWASPTLNKLITVQPWLGSGVTRWPRNHCGDLTQQAGYTTAGFFYYLVECTGNSQNGQLGQVVLSNTIRRMDPDLRWDYVRAPRKRSIVNETAYGSKTIYSRHTTQFILEGEQRMDEGLFLDQEAHFYDAEGLALPWLLIPDGDEPDVYFVRWREDVYATTHHFIDVRDRKFTVEELSRGLRPGV